MAPHRRSGSLALAAVIVVLGVLATSAVTVLIAGKERRSARQAIDRQAELAAAAITGEVRRYLDTVETVAAALSSHDVLGPAAFERATARLPEQNRPGATALVFVVSATTAQTGPVQQHWRAAGATGLSLQPAAGLDEHFFVVYDRQLDGSSAPAGGGDLAANPNVADVLREARRTGRAAVSNAAVLARDTGLPSAKQRRTLSLAAPVVAADGQQAGWVLLGLRGQGFFNGALREVLLRRVTATLSATEAGGGLLPIATVNPTAPPGDSLHRGTDLDVAQRRWHLDVTADPRDLPGTHTDRPLIAAATGGLLTTLLTLLVYLLATRRAKALALVEEATADLRVAGREAREQAALQQAILTSLSEGVAVFGADGRVLLHNPAARQLLGTADDADHLEDWPAHHGAYLPDRLTPFPTADLPMVRALRGVSVDHVEMVIRNPAHPEGILVSVTARPLDQSAGGPRGVVAVLHDITELRRYETELAQFAAVVAHDLKSPLTAVHGFAAVAADALPPATPGTARAALERVRQGATRMRVIIDDLLAYTTARDAPLNLTDVDLRDIVDAVVAERTAAPAAASPTAPLAMATQVSPPPMPDIRIGPLPSVEADPGLLRLVVDNLIGNAVKYTPAGERPQIEISAHVEAHGVHLEVADRGIGIPDSEKARVFESFYRVRPVDYGGTGLGLAICRRIVERHGGSIAVEDNPGGGTRFSVFLPADGHGPAHAGWEALMRPSGSLTSTA